MEVEFWLGGEEVDDVGDSVVELVFEEVCV